MKTTDYGKGQRLKSLLRLCLCLILVGLITVGAIGCTAQSSTVGRLPSVQVYKAEPLELNDGAAAPSSTAGKLPDIRMFEAESLVLNDGDAAVYRFVVKRATEIHLIEAGDNIKDINNPSSATLKGTVKGLPTYAIRTGNSNTFEAVLRARNGSGEVEEMLTLSFATELLPGTAHLIPPVSATADDQPMTPLWGPQYSSPIPTQPAPSTTTQDKPEFAECPKGCEFCLKPDEAASLGFTQKCSEELCYYSPNNEKWYCYKESEGWCCKDLQVSQTTKTECQKMGGEWYTTQTDAERACQPMCWCCTHGGQVGLVPEAQCFQLGGDCFFSQQQAIQTCQQRAMCWCCAGGKIGQIPQAQCAQMGGYCYATQQQAQQACQPPPVTYWCCSGGKVYPTTQPTDGCYTTRAQAERACQPPPYQPPPTHLQ